MENKYKEAADTMDKFGAAVAASGCAWMVLIVLMVFLTVVISTLF